MDIPRADTRILAQNKSSFIAIESFTELRNKPFVSLALSMAREIFPKAGKGVFVFFDKKKLTDYASCAG